MSSCFRCWPWNFWHNGLFSWNLEWRWLIMDSTSIQSFRQFQLFPLGKWRLNSSCKLKWNWVWFRLWQWWLFSVMTFFVYWWLKIIFFTIVGSSWHSFWTLSWHAVKYHIHLLCPRWSWYWRVLRERLKFFRLVLGTGCHRVEIWTLTWWKFIFQKQTLKSCHVLSLVLRARSNMFSFFQKRLDKWFRSRCR